MFAESADFWVLQELRFHSVSLNVNNPHFLIMQGRITKVINMKPQDCLDPKKASLENFPLEISHMIES